MRELTQDDYETTIKEGNVVVDFWAPWCGPCKMFGPIFEEVAAEEKDIVLAKVNTEDQQELAGKAGIRAIPTIVFYKDGKEVERVSGAMLKPQFKQKLEEVFGNA